MGLRQYTIIGSKYPALTTINGKLFAISANDWIELPNWVKDMSDIKYVPDLQTFTCQFEPYDFEQWTNHRQLLETNDKYKKLFQLFVLQQYLKIHGIDLIPDKCKFLPDITFEQLLSTRLNMSSKQIDCSIITKQVKSSRNNDTYTVTFNTATGESHCTCKGFEFRKTCKHVTALLESIRNNDK